MSDLILPDVDDPVAGPFWAGCADGELRIQACGACGARRMPPRVMCPACGSFDVRWDAVGPAATVWSFCVPHPPLLPAYAERLPYAVLVVALDDDPAIRLVGDTAEGVDPYRVAIGQPVTASFERVAADVVLPLAALGLTVAGCPEGGGPTSPDPVRFVLDGEPGPCRMVFGPVVADPFFVFEEVADILTPDGPTTALRGYFFAERFDGPDLQIDGISVYLSSDDDSTSATWSLPPNEMSVSTASLVEDELRELLPALVHAVDVRAVADILARRIPGAEVRYAGPYARYDIGLSYSDEVLLASGRGISDDRLDASYGVFGDEAEEVDGEWRTQVIQATTSLARGATLVVGDRRRREVDAEAFVEQVDRVMGDQGPAVGVSEGIVGVAGSSCEPLADPQPTGTVTDVSIAESDVGDLLRITFEGLPPDHVDPRLVHVTVGDVELVAPYDGDETVTFPATFTHAEARLLRDAVRRSGG